MAGYVERGCRHAEAGKWRVRGALHPVSYTHLDVYKRQVESRQNKRPQLSDLRDSGCLTGDTLVTLADSGQRVAMRDLAGRQGFDVWALNPATYQICLLYTSRCV